MKVKNIISILNFKYQILNAIEISRNIRFNIISSCAKITQRYSKYLVQSGLLGAHTQHNDGFISP